MQSEFACHIGLKGKLFCRACWVKGSDALGVQEQAGSLNASVHSGEASDTGSLAGGEVTDDESTSPTSSKKAKGRRKKLLESFSNMVERVKAFIKVRDG
jgi:hypothetical protein